MIKVAMIKVAQQSKLKVCYEPVSSSRRDFLYFYTANGSSVVWHLGQSCLDRLENASKYTFFGVEKHPFSSYSARMRVTVLREIPEKVYSKCFLLQGNR